MHEERTDDRDPLVARAQDVAWERGQLRFLLDQTQQEIYDFVKAQKGQTYISASRQLGKSFVMLVMAIEFALKNPWKRVNYVSKTYGAVKKFTEDSMRVICEHAPAHCRPEFRAQDSRWLFPNGGYIQLVGADEDRGADTARGPSVVANFIDEAGFISCLQYLLGSVIVPMGIRTGAKTVLATSPAYSPGHYSTELEDAAAASGSLITRDYWSPGLLSLEQKKAYVAQLASDANQTVEAFMATSEFRREFLCQRVLDSNLAVVPEFPAVKEAITKKHPRPPHFDLYVSMDPGMDDFTGILIAYYDFRAAKLVITNELLLKQANTRTIGESLRRVLQEEYPNVIPYSMVADDPHKRLCADLHNEHQLAFSPARKDDSEAAINLMRLEIGGQQVWIDPSCTNLLRQLGTAIRTKVGGDMARSKRDGHFDLVAALKYLIRSVDKNHNPYPPNFGFDPYTQARRSAPQGENTLAKALMGGTYLGKKLKIR